MNKCSHRYGTKLKLITVGEARGKAIFENRACCSNCGVTMEEIERARMTFKRNPSEQISKFNERYKR